MARATLVLDADVSALRRAMGEIPGITRRAQAVMTSQARRGGSERVALDRSFGREHESIHMRLLRAREKQAKDATAKEASEGRRQVQNDADFARQRDSIHTQLARARERQAAATTRREASEGRKQVAADAAFARERDSIHARLTSARVARERAAQRGVDQATRERRAAGEAAGSGAASAAEGIASGAHGEIQAARQTVADRTSAINTSLVQRGTSETENAADNARIQARLRRVATGVPVDTAIEAIAGAQGFANALGGDSAAERARNIDATLSDVELAGAIDPTNVGGIVNMGAILRRRVQGSGPAVDALRGSILRGAVGTSFEGSVETDQMVTAGLPGLLRAISSGTANARTDTERNQLTAEIAQDFFAQLQAQAAGGRTVGVAANRTNTVRDALSNATRQNRMGLALAETARTGTPEQRAAFAAAFTKGADGQYTMNADVRDTPSNAARFFGTMFNNDAGALRNAMGANGLGGARQLMNAPDVDAIASYFGMTTASNGSQMREYDHVDELKGASLSPEQEAAMRHTRATEDRTRLLREAEARIAAQDPNATGAAGRLSNAAHTFANEHPWLTMGGISAGLPALAAGAKSLGGWALASMGGGPAALAGLAAVAGTGLAFYGDAKAAGSGVDAQGNRLSTGERATRGVAATVAESLFSGAAIVPLFRELISAVERIGSAPVTATVSPHDAAHAASANPPAGAPRVMR